MTPTEIRDILAAACPELAWWVDDTFVRAEGTRLYAFEIMNGFHEPLVYLARDLDLPTIVQSDLPTVRREVWARLSKEEILSAPGASLLDARVTLDQRRARVKACQDELADAGKQYRQAARVLQDATDRLVAAEIAAEAAAKRLGVET